MKEFDELDLINLISLLLIAIVLALPNNPLRIALGLPFVLFFPGYTLIAALYPRHDDLENVERLALSFGLSLAVVPLIGLMLNFLPWGIHLKPILISLAGFIIICSVLAARARRQLSRTECFSIEIVPLVTRARRLSLSKIAVATIVIAFIAFVGWRLHAATSHKGETFTEFYILGPSGKAEGYPDRVTAGESAEVVLGIINHESQRATYKVSIQAEDQVLSTVGPVALNDGQKWERIMRFRPVKPRNREKVEFLLFKDDNPTPYRHLHLWIKVLST
jgi:uncharacterized membrane protein